jgi:hypothetical protein
VSQPEQQRRQNAVLDLRRKHRRRTGFAAQLERAPQDEYRGGDTLAPGLVDAGAEVQRPVQRLVQQPPQVPLDALLPDRQHQLTHPRCPPHGEVLVEAERGGPGVVGDGRLATVVDEHASTGDEVHRHLVDRRRAGDLDGRPVRGRHQAHPA